MYPSCSYLLCCIIIIFKYFIMQFLCQTFLYYLQEKVSHNTKSAAKIVSVFQALYIITDVNFNLWIMTHVKYECGSDLHEAHMRNDLSNICCSSEIVQNMSQYLPRWQNCTATTLYTSSISAAETKTNGLGFHPLIKFRKMIGTRNQRSWCIVYISGTLYHYVSGWSLL